MSFDARPVLDAVLRGYALDLRGIHGVAHWARVMENGLRLAEETGADAEVVRLFALLHDSRRLDDGADPDHGPRAAEFAVTLQDKAFRLSEARFKQLHAACAGHTHERTHPDNTVRTCFDADRLDLGRIGIKPLAKFLCTDVARRDDTIAWAHERASARLIPAFIREDWRVDLAVPR